MGISGSFSGVKRPGLEADYPPPSTSKLRMSGAVPPLMACLVKERMLLQCVVLS